MKSLQSANDEDEDRKLAANDDMKITPTSPLVDCLNSAWGEPTTGTTTTTTYAYALGLNLGCAQLTAKIPGSFNYNYDYNTKKATKSLDIGSGVSCSNCFAFMGMN